ncbi:MAG: hypothetical protein JF571_08790 [Asticcacaulis sp.]|nr:hypothetical protein [Asticcacaulis sp.]
MNWALINFVWQYGFFALAVIVCGWAMSWGGRAERNAALLILAGWTLSLIVQDHTPNGLDVPLALVDVVVCAILIFMSTRERKPWLLLMAAAQFDTVMVHFAQWCVRYNIYPYAVALGLLSGVGQFPLLAWGVIQYRVVERRRWSNGTQA